MNPISGYVWEATSNTGKKWRVLTEGCNLDEALSEFRRLHGNRYTLFQIKYFAKYGELDA